MQLHTRKAKEDTDIDRSNDCAKQSDLHLQLNLKLKSIITNVLIQLIQE